MNFKPGHIVVNKYSLINPLFMYVLLEHKDYNLWITGMLRSSKIDFYEEVLITLNLSCYKLYTDIFEGEYE